MEYSRVNKRSKKAVAPVLATLLMIAVAVSMSVIIFMWAQGFLSQTSESTGSQQGSQNQAAQSSVAIENVLFNGTKATVYIRNVGAVSVIPAMGTAAGISSNAGFKTSAINATNIIPLSLAKGKGGSTTFTLTGLTSGDTVSFKITTSVGTFAQSTYTVP